MNIADAVKDIESVLSYSTGQGGVCQVTAFASLVATCVERWAPSSSHYRKTLQEFQRLSIYKSKTIAAFRGVLQALLEDVKNNRLVSFEEMVHASLWDDFLVQADYLVNQNYLLAAGVIVGGVLEDHLRKLAVKIGISVTKGSNEPKSASALNDEVYKEGVYSKAEHSQVQAWIHIRNEAAHNNTGFAKRTALDLEQMTTGIRTFIIRFPA